MNIQTANFVTSSDLFEGFSELKNNFNAGDHDFSFGDNNRTLISIERFFEGVEYTNRNRHEQTVVDFRQRLMLLPPDTYVDLEN